MIATCLCAAGACGERVSPERVRPGEALDAIVVLGHRPALDATGRIDYEIRARVDRGIALFSAGAAPRLLLVGGESTPGVVEADVMAQYARERGVPDAAILLERDSKDTIENARFAINVLRRELGAARTPKIVLVTSDYHVERAAHLLRCAGADVVVEPVPLEQLSAGERRTRERTERFVRLYYSFIDECGRAR